MYYKLGQGFRVYWSIQYWRLWCIYRGHILLCSSLIIFILASNIFLCLYKGHFTFIVLIGAIFWPDIQYLFRCHLIARLGSPQFKYQTSSLLTSCLCSFSRHNSCRRIFQLVLRQDLCVYGHDCQLEHHNNWKAFQRRTGKGI